MASPYVNFLSYNSTGMNEIKAKWIKDLVNVTNASFIGVQEHFKTVNLENSFDNLFPEHNHHIEPGVREAGQDNGRAKGGLLQLIQKSLDIKVTKIRCEHFRIQAQLLSFPNITLLWINAYFPTDNQTITDDSSDLVETCSAIEKLMDETNFTDVIIQGDFNWDNSRESRHSIYMREFTQRIGLQSV